MSDTVSLIFDINDALPFGFSLGGAVPQPSDGSKPINASVYAQSAGVPILGSISPAGDIIEINDMEQGSISSSGNTSSTTKIRSAGYYSIPNGKTGIQIYGVSNVSSKKLQFDVLTYDDNNTLIDDLYWYAMGLSVGFSAGATKFRIVLRFSDTSNITPNDASNVKAALI